MKYPPLKVPPDDDGLISLMCCNLKRTSSERNCADDGHENRKGPVLLKFQPNVKKHCGKALGTQLSPFFGPSQKIRSCLQILRKKAQIFCSRFTMTE